MKNQSDKTIEVIRRKDRPLECFMANGILYCSCGKCRPSDFKLPLDMVEISYKDWVGLIGSNGIS